jgi:hypothetical protein
MEKSALIYFRSFILMTLSKKVLDQVQEATKEVPDDQPSITDMEGDRKRNGTWIDPQHVDAAASNPARTQAFYNAASKADNMYDEEYYLARVFQMPNFADKIAAQFFVKEIRGGLMQVGDSIDIDDISNQLNAEFDHGMFYLRADARTPDEIIEADQVVQIMYREIDKEWPGRPQNKMVLTYALIRARMDHLMWNEIPMYKRTLDIIDRIEKDEKNWESQTIFQEYSGISRKMYDTVIGFLRKKVEEYGVDLL